MLYLIRALSVGRTHSSFERLQRPSRDAVQLVGVDGSERMLFSESCSKFSGTLTEHEKIRQRVATQTIRAMQSTPGFTGGKQTRHRRHLGLGMDSNAAH